LTDYSLVYSLGEKWFNIAAAGGRRLSAYKLSILGKPALSLAFAALANPSHRRHPAFCHDQRYPLGLATSKAWIRDPMPDWAVLRSYARLRPTGRLMNDTLTLNKLEKLLEMETQIRAEYKPQLEEKDASIAQLSAEKATLETKIADMEKTIATQLATITELSGKSKDTSSLEQRNRELHNRSENMKEEVASVKSRIKSLQKDLASERAELAELKKYDPQRLRKNLDASKKKLADKTKAADKLQKSLNQVRSENAELEQKIKDLEAKLEAIEAERADQADEGQQAAA